MENILLNQAYQVRLSQFTLIKVSLDSFFFSSLTLDLFANGE